MSHGDTGKLTRGADRRAAACRSRRSLPAFTQSGRRLGDLLVNQPVPWTCRFIGDQCQLDQGNNVLQVGVQLLLQIGINMCVISSKLYVATVRLSVDLPFGVGRISNMELWYREALDNSQKLIVINGSKLLCLRAGCKSDRPALLRLGRINQRTRSARQSESPCPTNRSLQQTGVDGGDHKRHRVTIHRHAV